MKIVGYSHSRISDPEVIQSFLDVIGFELGKISPFISTERGGVSVEKRRIDKSLKSDSSLAIYQDDTFSLILEWYDFNFPNKKFPHLRTELYLFEDIGDEKLFRFLNKMSRIAGFELGFVVENEFQLSLYNSGPLGIGVGLIDVTWMMHFGPSYKSIINDTIKDSVSRFEEDCHSLTVCFFEDYRLFLRAMETDVDSLKRIVGLELFLPYNAETYLKRNETNEPASGWAFSPKVLKSLFSSFRKSEEANGNHRQATKVPDRYL